MKAKLTILAVALSLSGCAMFSSRDYDPIEYSYAIDIATDATHAVHRCATRSDGFDTYLQKINATSFTLVEYVSNKADSTQVLPAAMQVRDVSLSFLMTPSYSNRYCQHKLSNIQASARMFARGVGNTDRFNICAGNVQDRFAAFQKSFDENAITKSEFVDLSGDLIRMKTIDSSSCTLEQRVEFESTINGIQAALSILTIF